jgi:hypothetical protein
MEPPYPWRTVGSNSSYIWACHDCDQHAAADIETYRDLAIAHSRETGHRCQTSAMQTTVYEGIKT